MMTTKQDIIVQAKILFQTLLIEKTHVIQSKYSNWYVDIISNAIISERSNGVNYFEKHHIIPKCIGGSNNKENLVLLTAREHFICHLLLSRMSTGIFKIKMDCAIHYLATNQHAKIKITSRVFAKIRSNFSKSMSLIMKGKIRVQSDEEKRLRSINQRGRILSEQTKSKIANSHKGKKHSPHSENTKLAISTSNTGKFHSSETKEHISLTISKLFEIDKSYKMRISQSVSRVNTGKCWVNDGIHTRFVTKHTKDELLEKGWKSGRKIIS